MRANFRSKTKDQIRLPRRLIRIEFRQIRPENAATPWGVVQMVMPNEARWTLNAKLARKSSVPLCVCVLATVFGCGGAGDVEKDRPPGRTRKHRARAS